MERYDLRTSPHLTISIFYLLGIAGVILFEGLNLLEPFAALADGQAASFGGGWWLAFVGLLGYLGYQLWRPAYLTLSDRGLKIHAPNAEFLPLSRITEAKLPPLGRLRVDRYAHRWGLSFGPTAFDRAPEGLVLVKAGPSWYGLRVAEPEQFLAALQERLAKQRSAG